jgi:hypothetical protein
LDLGDCDSFTLDNLEVLKTAQHVMLNLESSCQVESASLLKLERVVFEGLESTRGRNIELDWWTTFRVHLKGQDDAVAWVIGIAQILSTATESKRFLVSLQRLILGICNGLFSQ